MILKNEIKTDMECGLILFDIDGTLINNDYEALYKTVLQNLNIPYHQEYFPYIMHAIDNALARTAISKKNFTDLLCEYCEFYLPVLKTHPISGKQFIEKMLIFEKNYCFEIPQAYETVKQISFHNKNLVIDTNWFVSSQKNKLNHFGLLPFFQHIYSCEGIPAKPSPIHFRHILWKENMPAQKTIIVGDSSTDILASQIDITTILYDSDQTKQELYPFACAVVTEFPDIYQVISKTKTYQK